MRKGESMSVRLVGNVVKEGSSFYFCVLGWNKEGSYVNDPHDVQSLNPKAKKLEEQFLVDAPNIPSEMDPWILYAFDCGDSDKCVNDFRKLIRVPDARLVIFNRNFWTDKEAGSFVNYTEVCEHLDKKSMKEAYIIKKANDECLYGLFDRQKNVLKKYNVNKENILVKRDRTQTIEYGFVCEKKMRDANELIDCSTEEQLKNWFVKEYNSDINAFVKAGSNVTGLERIRWDRFKYLIDTLQFQENELLDVFERTRNSGFGKIIVEAAKKAIKDDYTKELSDSDETIRVLVEKKRSVENEIRALEEKKKDVEHDIEQGALQRKTQLEREFNELNSKKSELEKDCEELNERKAQKEGEIKEFEKQKNVLNAEQARIAEENNQKVANLEKALQNVKEKYSDLLDGLKVITSEKDDGEEILLPIYENDEDVDGAEEEWNGIPRASIVESIKQVCRRVEDCGLCKVYELHVEHDWLHYSDFVNHGLIKIWKEAASNSAIHFVLVLDSLNLTHPECGMKPLLDSFECKIPLLGTKLKRPENLKIMATLLPTEGDGAIGQDISAVIKWPKLETLNHTIDVY